MLVRFVLSVFAIDLAMIAEEEYELKAEHHTGHVNRRKYHSEPQLGIEGISSHEEGCQPGQALEEGLEEGAEKVLSRMLKLRKVREGEEVLCLLPSQGNDRAHPAHDTPDEVGVVADPTENVHETREPRDVLEQLGEDDEEGDHGHEGGLDRAGDHTGLAAEVLGVVQPLLASFLLVLFVPVSLLIQRFAGLLNACPIVSGNQWFSLWGPFAWNVFRGVVAAG